MTDSLRSAHSEENGCEKKNTKLGGRTETDRTSGRGSKLYIFKCKNQTDKIFVNIKFLVCFPFFFSFSFFFFEGMNEMLLCDNKRQQVQFAKNGHERDV